MSEPQTTPMAGDTPREWPTKNAAWRGYASERWGISRRTFFNHVPDAVAYDAGMIDGIALARGWRPLPLSGALSVEGEGGARRAADESQEAGGAPRGKRAQADAERYWSAKADRERAEADLKALELRRKEGLLVAKEDVERSLAARAALFKMRADQGVTVLAESIVFDCGGSPDQVADVRDRIRHLIFDELDRMTRYSEIMVEVEDA